MSSFYCNWCKTTLNSKVQWDQHILGSKHVKAQNAEKALSMMHTGNPLPLNQNPNFLSSDMVDFSSASIKQLYFNVPIMIY
jgi:hypothetical protein